MSERFVLNETSYFGRGAREELANEMGVHFQTVSKWERGVSTPDLSLLSTLAEKLKVSLENLLGLPEVEKPIKGNFTITALSKAISNYRKQNRFTQSDIAKKLLVSADTVSKWERGVILPDIDGLIKLAEIFNVPVSYLYFGKIKSVEGIKQPKNTTKLKWLKPLFTILTSLVVLSVGTFFILERGECNE